MCSYILKSEDQCLDAMKAAVKEVFKSNLHHNTGSNHNTVSNEELKIDGYNLLRSDRNKNGGGVACYIKNNNAHNQQSSISENIEILFWSYQYLSKPIAESIIYRPPTQVDFIDHFNNALGKLPRLKEAQLKHGLLRPDMETFLAFRLNQLTEKPTRSS